MVINDTRALELSEDTSFFFAEFCTESACSAEYENDGIKKRQSIKRDKKRIGLKR
jgi:hypothetical protein